MPVRQARLCREVQLNQRNKTGIEEGPTVIALLRALVLSPHSVNTLALCRHPRAHTCDRVSCVVIARCLKDTKEEFKVATQSHIVNDLQIGVCWPM